MVQIINRQLIELDKKVGDFYKLSARYLDSLIGLLFEQIESPELSLSKILL